MKTENSPPVPLALCITDLDDGGAERALVRLATGLDRGRWSPAVYCLGPRGVLAEVLERAGVPVTCLGARSKWNAGVVLTLLRHLRRQRPALLQTFLHHANVAGRIAGWLAGVPHIVSGIRVAEKRSLWPLRRERWTERLVERHVCVSSGVAEFSCAVGGLSRRKVLVIPNGVAAAEIAAAEPGDLREFGIPAGAPTLVGVGRLDPQKGWLVLLDALPIVRRRFPDVHLLLIGDGPQRGELDRAAAERGLAECVHFAGRRADVPRWLRAASCFVSASLWEGMSNALLEALAAGAPVVATRVEGTDELLRSVGAGRLADPGSSASLAAAIEETLADPAGARADAHRAQQVLAAEWTWERMIARYDALYTQLIDPAAASPSNPP